MDKSQELKYWKLIIVFSLNFILRNYFALLCIWYRKQRIQRITRTLTRSDALILKSPDPPPNPSQDVFQETVNGLQRSPKPGVGGSTGLTPQSPPRSPSPNPRSSSPKKQPKTMSHTGIIPLASHLVTARRVHRHLNKSLTLTAHTVPSSSSSSVRSSSSGSSEFLKVSQDRRHSACPPIGRRPRKRLGMLHPSYSHSPRVSPRHTPKSRYSLKQ